jgi:hypothetical protein
MRKLFLSRKKYGLRKVNFSLPADAVAYCGRRPNCLAASFSLHFPASAPGPFYLALRSLGLMQFTCEKRAEAGRHGRAKTHAIVRCE